MEVEGCGAGIMLIERSCVKTLLEKLPQLSDTKAKKTSPLARNLERLIRAFEPVTVDGGRLSEDYSFCHRWRASCGGEVWANISHRVIHVGLHRFAGRYQDAMPRGPRIVVGDVPGTAAGKQGASKPTVTKSTGRITIKEGGLQAAVKQGSLKAAVAAPERGVVATPKRIMAQAVVSATRRDKPNGK